MRARAGGTLRLSVVVLLLVLVLGLVLGMASGNRLGHHREGRRAEPVNGANIALLLRTMSTRIKRAVPLGQRLRS